MEDVLYLINCTLMLFAYISMSVYASGVHKIGQYTVSTGILFSICEVMQLFSIILTDSNTGWKLYPFIMHIPICIYLTAVFRTGVIKAVSTVAVVYLICQPANWAGGLVFLITGHNLIYEYVARYAAIIIIHTIAMKKILPAFPNIHLKSPRDILVFSIVPIIYYVTEYVVCIFPGPVAGYERAFVEVIPFTICAAYLAFWKLRYTEYEEKVKSERDSQVRETLIGHQQRMINNINKNIREVTLLRKDLESIFENPDFYSSRGDREKIKKLAGKCVDRMDASSGVSYCNSSVINYIINKGKERAEENNTELSLDIRIDNLKTDEHLYGGILAKLIIKILEEQAELPEEKRKIQLRLRSIDNKDFIIAKRTAAENAAIVGKLSDISKENDCQGMPFVMYMTEELGGTCEFSNIRSENVVRIQL